MTNNLKKFFATLVVVTLVVPVIGTGTAFAEEGIPLDSTDVVIESGKTYTISNADELYNFASIVNDGGQTFEGAKVELLNDIKVIEGQISYMDENGVFSPLLDRKPFPDDGSLKWWVPIGEHMAVFKGIFDGNNHSISGLWVDFGSGGGYALFQNCWGAVIRNVSVENFYFCGYNCAGICADARGNTIIENCKAIGIIINRGSSGGIVGRAYNYNNEAVKSAQVINCESICFISEGIPHTAGISKSSYTGGIAGHCKDAVVTECTNHSRITGTDYIGLIIGCADEGTMEYGNVNETAGSAVGAEYKNRMVGNRADTEIHKHSYSAGFDYDDTHHYHKCLTCGEETQRHAHVFDASKETVIKDSGSTNYGRKVRVCSRCNAHIMTENTFTGIVTIDIDYSKCKVVYIDRDTVTFHAEPGYVISEVLVNTIPVSVDAQIDLSDWDDIKVTVREKMPASNETLIKGVQNTTLKVKTVLVGDRQIRVVWTKSKGYKVDYYEIYRSTKKSKTTSGKPFYTTKSGNTKSYCSARNLKVGTKYYYKVRGVREIDGKKYYTKWSNYGIRTFRG